MCLLASTEPSHRHNEKAPHTTTIKFSLFSLLTALSSERAAEMHAIKTKNSYSVIVKTIFLNFFICKTETITFLI